MKYYAQHLNAGHDGNGNPRRGFLVYDEHGTTIEYIDEGYRGDSALTKPYPKHVCVQLGRLDTTAFQLRSLKKEFPEKNDWYVLVSMERVVLAVFGSALEEDASKKRVAIERETGATGSVNIHFIRSAKPKVGEILPYAAQIALS